MLTLAHFEAVDRVRDAFEEVFPPDISFVRIFDGSILEAVLSHAAQFGDCRSIPRRSSATFGRGGHLIVFFGAHWTLPRLLCLSFSFFFAAFAAS
jgi:hypothetical protein